MNKSSVGTGRASDSTLASRVKTNKPQLQRGRQWVKGGDAQNFRIGTVNLNTLNGKQGQVVETLTRRRIDICCVQEIKWRGGHARRVMGKDSYYKFFWQGDNLGKAGVGIV